MIFLAAGLLPVGAAAADASVPPVISAEAMILVHPASGSVLASKNAEEPRLIASTTKLMTALTAVETLPLDAEVEILDEWTRAEGSSMYLRPGERRPVRELLEGLLIASGNDAALALSAGSGEPDRFLERMNEKAAELGLSHTHFENPHGLDAKGHYSCAADLARIMAAALKNETLRTIMGERSVRIRGVSYENHNKLLRSCPGVFAGKTGYTMAAGRCLVSACERDGMELICVTLSDPHDWRDHASLYDWAFGRYREVSVRAGERAGETAVIGERIEPGPVTAGESLSLCVPKETEVRTELVLPPFAFAPVAVGEGAGVLNVILDGEKAASVPLVWERTVRGGTRESLRDLGDRLLGIYRV